MADVDYRDMFWMVRDELPGIPVPTLFYRYAETVRDFCARSKAWQYDIPTALSLNANTAWPTITAGTHIPDDTYIVEPVRVKWAADGDVITFKTRDQLDAIDRDWESLTGTRGRYWTITSPGSYRLYPLLAETTTDALRLRVALAPRVDVATPRTSIPEELANEWKQVWAHGVLSSCMKMPGKDWTNVQLAKAYGDLYEEGIKMAKSRAAADYGRPDRSVRYGGLSIGGSGRRTVDDYGR